MAKRRSWNVAPYAEWLRRLQPVWIPRTSEELLTAADVDAERAYIGLRTTDGLVLTEELHASTARWRDAGWARIVNDRLAAHATRLAAPGRPRRRLDPRWKSLVDLHLWRISSTNVNAGFWKR